MMAICSSDDITRWFQEAGDPNIVAWIITVGYAIAAWTSHTAATHAKVQRRSRATQRFWQVLMIAMILLGLNKQLDLQSLLIDCGRTMSREGGWFAHRRMVERGFATALAASLALILILGLRRMRRPSPAMILAIAGVGMLVGFILLRSASILHIPGLDQATNGLLQNMLELCGVGAVALGGYRATARSSAR